ncbi:hypothetical protein REH70_02000 [Cellulomonas sp. ATA003]|nr:hypothetical protein [Cellulomonas sp. ATA003]WNB86082.1 hypothetical protein REH70_02000 [Cellulomonas sp. ATA003]
MNITITRDTHTWRFTDRFGNPIRSTMDSLSAADPPGTDGPG